MTDGEADIFSAVADRLTSINVAFIQAAVPPFLQTLQQCVDVDLVYIIIRCISKCWIYCVFRSE